MATDLPPNAVQPANRKTWRAWLAKHHTQPDGVWLVTFKKNSGQPLLPYNDAVEEALCFGWVDSKPRKLDEQRSMLWFAPRKGSSGWSAINKARIVKMQTAGLMTPAGQAKIDAAIADGSWGLLDAVDALEIPTDLTQAFKQRPGSAQHFDAFPKSVRRGILEWIAQAKRPETRAARIAQTAEMAAANQRANQWRYAKPASSLPSV